MVAGQDHEQGPPTKEEDVMAKAAARRRVLRGTIANASYKKIQLDNMDVSDGWMVTKFEVCSTASQQGIPNVAIGTLCTEEPNLTTWAVPGSWNFGESRQMGWSRFANMTAADETGLYSLVDSNNILIQDLDIVAFLRNETTDERMNYYIEIERITFPRTTGIMAMVQNRGQDLD